MRKWKWNALSFQWSFNSYDLFFFHTWSPESSWPYDSWVIVCFSRPSLFLYRNIGFTFPNLHIDLFPLTLIRCWPKYYGTFLLHNSYKFHASMHMYQSVSHNLCIIFCRNFGSMTDCVCFPMNSASTQTAKYSENPQ